MNRSIFVPVKPNQKFFCPVCGESTLECKHILFVFSIYGEFYNVAPKMRPYTKMWENDEFCDELDEKNIGIMDYLEEKMPKSAVLFGFQNEDDVWYVCVDFKK